jgi:hypothetical protein
MRDQDHYGDEPEGAASPREKVLAFVRSRGREGATDEEIQEALGMNPSTERPRRIELYKVDLVYDSGTLRPTRSGRKAVVWMAEGA